MRRLSSTLAAAAVGVLLLCASPARADPVTFAFTATLTDDPYGSSRFGAPIAGSFTFDATAVDGIADPATGAFASLGAVYGFTVDVDGMTYAVAGNATVVTANDIGVDQYGVVATDGALTLELLLQDFTETALSSDGLPVTAPSLSAFGSRRFSLLADDAEFEGDVTSLVCTAGCAAPAAVPEPGSLLLVGIGVGAFAIRRRIRPAARRPRFAAA